MLGFLFISDLRSAHFFSTWRKCEAQRIFACFVQAHSQCSAANTNQVNCRNASLDHWRNGFTKANQTPCIRKWKERCLSAEPLKWQPLRFCEWGISSAYFMWYEHGGFNLPFRYSTLYSAQFNYYPVPVFTNPFGRILWLLVCFYFYFLN